MTYYVAIKFDQECWDGSFLDLRVDQTLQTLMHICDQISGKAFKWAACPGGKDPAFPEQSSPVYFSYDLETGDERTWEIFEAEHEELEE